MRPGTASARPGTSSRTQRRRRRHRSTATRSAGAAGCCLRPDRKSTRLNSSHRCISYAVFCLKKKNSHRRKKRPSNQETQPPSNNKKCGSREHDLVAEAVDDRANDDRGDEDAEVQHLETVALL